MAYVNFGQVMLGDATLKGFSFTSSNEALARGSWMLCRGLIDAGAAVKPSEQLSTSAPSPRQELPPNCAVDLLQRAKETRCIQGNLLERDMLT